MSYGLGRRAAPDERDKRFPLQAVVPRQSARTWRYWYAGARLNQGATSQCVGYSAAHFLTSSPNPHSVPPVSPTQVYALAQQNDEWSGEDYEGSSVRAGMKALSLLGQITNDYRWAWDINTIALCLLERGPVLAGTAWTDGMFTPDSYFNIVPSGDVAGGHAYLLDGVNMETKRFRLLNSWGPGWSKNGRASIDFDDFDYLLQDDGEAVSCIEGVA